MEQILANIRLLMTLYSKPEKTFIIKEALPSKTTINIPFLLKSDNQGSIALAHNTVFYTQIKYINIQHYYI